MEIPPACTFSGGQVQKTVTPEAREKVADLLGADPDRRIVFTSCGDESDNAATRGALDSYLEKPAFPHSRVEHAAGNNVATYLSRKGYRVTGSW